MFLVITKKSMFSNCNIYIIVIQLI